MLNTETAFPPLFLAHGSPMLALTDIPAHRYLKTMAADLPRPTGLIVMSAHWETSGLRVSAPGPLKTIHDFRGFPQALYDIQYPAAASDALVQGALGQFAKAGLSAVADAGWGLDHGAWVPLSLIWPELDVPVIQVSIPYGSSPRDIYAIGRALAPLRAEGIAMIGSGSTTHNLRQIAPEGSPPAPWAETFDAWLDAGLAGGDISAFDDLSDAPNLPLAHPSLEHFLPVFFAMGAAEGSAPELTHRTYSHGSLSMSYFRLPEAEAA